MLKAEFRRSLVKTILPLYLPLVGVGLGVACDIRNHLRSVLPCTIRVDVINSTSETAQKITTVNKHLACVLLISLNDLPSVQSCRRAVATPPGQGISQMPIDAATLSIKPHLQHYGCPNRRRYSVGVMNASIRAFLPSSLAGLPYWFRIPSQNWRPPGSGVRRRYCR